MSNLRISWKEVGENPKVERLCDKIIMILSIMLMKLLIKADDFVIVSDIVRGQKDLLAP